MFTGIVEEMGVVNICEKDLAGTKLSILASSVLDDLKVGDSVSLSGICLTVDGVGTESFTVQVSMETMRVTTLGSLVVGSAVNLERAMQLNKRIGGHLVSGHVDGVGVVRERIQEGNAFHLSIEAPKEILRLCIQKGSITVDGISLTINQVNDNGFSVAIIPHTAHVTILGRKQVGDHVNLESDLVGKYVERLLQANGYLSQKSPVSIDRDYLQKHGLI